MQSSRTSHTMGTTELRTNCEKWSDKGASTYPSASNYLLGGWRYPVLTLSALTRSVSPSVTMAQIRGPHSPITISFIRDPQYFPDFPSTIQPNPAVRSRPPPCERPRPGAEAPMAPLLPHTPFHVSLAIKEAHQILPQSPPSPPPPPPSPPPVPHGPSPRAPPPQAHLRAGRRLRQRGHHRASDGRVA